MKKAITIGLILITLLFCLNGCTFTQKMSGAIADEAVSAPKVEEMMAALAGNRVSDAEALMHPQVSGNSEAGITQIVDYLDGRNVDAMELKSINVNTSTGTAGKARQEQVTYAATLTDGAVVYLTAFYLSNGDGDGFLSFQLILGVV